MSKKNKCNVEYFVEKYGMKMRGATYSSTKGWVKGIKECSKSQRRRILKKIENKYFDYPRSKLR